VQICTTEPARLIYSFSSGAHPAPYPMGSRTLSLGVGWPRHEDDHSPPYSTKVKSAWIYTSTPPYISRSWCLIKYTMSSWHGT